MARNPALLIIEGRYREAFETARARLAGQPKNVALISVAADALRLMSDYQNALLGYDAVLRASPADGYALRGRIATLVALGRREDALVDLRTVESLPRSKSLLHTASAMYYLDLHRTGYELTHSREALASADKGGISNVARVFEYTTGRLDEALRNVERAIAEGPTSGALHELRALILSDMGRHDEARSEVATALYRAPAHPEFKQTLGLVERMAGNPAAALPPLTESAGGRPWAGRPRGELLACLAQLGHVSEARAALESLPDYARQDAFVIYGIAALAAASGQTAGAVAGVAAAAGLRPELLLRARKDPVFADPVIVVALAAMPLPDRGRR